MRSAWVVIGVALVFASGCAQTDWIDRTLVTVDVTGVWEGTATLAALSSGGSRVNAVELVLEQKGAKVTGELKGFANFQGADRAPIPIEGTVSGDRFTFHQVRGTKMQVDLQVKGDEMTGGGTRDTAFTMTLRRRQ